MSKISLKHSGGNVVSLNSPTSAPTSADVAFKLPNQDGSASEALITDGSGNLSFASVAGGKILQVVSAHKSDTSSQACTSGTYYDITGLSASITPASSSNKILVLFNINAGLATGYRASFRLVRDSTAINIADASGSVRRMSFSSMVTGGNSQTEQASSNFLDSPSSTSSLTYKIQIEAEGGTHFINRTKGDGTSSIYHNGTSNLTLMEVAA